MDKVVALDRRHRLWPVQGVSSADLLMAPLPHRQRLSLRCPLEALPLLQPGWPADIPSRVGAATSHDGCSALCLGPDEWLLICPADFEPAIVGLAAGAAREHCSLTDVSHRSIGARIAGNRALEFLASVVPLDLDAMAAGAATRTLLGRLEALIWRRGEPSNFEIEVWRSYETYFWEFLEVAAAEMP